MNADERRLKCASVPLRMARRILVCFALLDAMLLGRFLHSVHLLIWEATSPVWWNVVMVLKSVFLLSLAVSAIGLALERRWACVLSYVQFPFRFVYALFSFGFLTLVPHTACDRVFWQPMFIIAACLECARAGVTIALHRRLACR